ncbi:MAG: ATP-binding cassette subfamily B multidrug efflux pump [Saprospiraceae bacterium]|jgi:ATP-binding cassette subfamily B protein|tara:strand:- start:5293 stop:7050 length:1758 start_codon:yes stop_codon:yes gene_type:complete
MSKKTATGKVFDFGVLWKVFKGIGPYKNTFILTGIIILSLAFLSVVRPFLIKNGLNNAFEDNDASVLVPYFLGMLGVLMIETVLQYYQTYLSNLVAQSVTLDLREKLYRKVLKFRLKFFDKTPVGSFVTRLISDIDGIAQIFSNGILTILGDIVKLIVVISAMMFISVELTLMVLIPIPVLLIGTRIFQKTIKKAFTEVRNQANKINVFTQEHITGMSIIQLFNREKREYEKFKQINKEHQDAHIRSVWAYAVFFPFVELLSATSMALLLWYGAGEVLSAQLTIPALIAMILFINMLYRPIRMLADRFNVLQMGIVNAERVFTMFERDELLNDTGTLDRKLEGNISFDKVSFAYVEDNYVLKEIDLEVKSGETVAFVGATGAGKSSIVNILSRFYEFQKGTISLDNQDIRKYTLDAVRSQISVVLQEVFLFSDSIYNNITLSNKDISREQVIEASKIVGAHEFIMALPGGYDYNVKERGVMLSSGQRQLIAFIRAYVANPSVLVLDEATSSVDTESEELIQSAIEKLTKGRTSIIIAHRLSTIQQADKIVVLEKGRIIEHGSHKELLSHDGQYKKLFELQFQESP